MHSHAVDPFAGGILLRSSLTISINDLIEFAEFRRALEGYSARQAATQATDAELAELGAMALMAATR